MSNVARIVGRPGMCSDDGRALTYGWSLYTNEASGQGFWNSPHWHPTEEAARDWCSVNGYEVQMTAWT